MVADWIWIPALLAWAIALWLVPGRRRKEVRAISIGLIVAGVVILVIRRVAGSYLVDHLTDSESIRPAVDAFWAILSDGLAEAAWVGVVVGVIGALGTWLTGEGGRAVATRTHRRARGSRAPAPPGRCSRPCSFWSSGPCLSSGS